MTQSLDDDLRCELASWEAAGLKRELRALSGGADFVTNDYLSLARHPAVVEAARTALAEHGAGGRAAPLLGGGSPLDRELESAVCGWLEAEDALLFCSGYQANVGLVPALVGRGDVVLSDALNHASLIDGARLSRAHLVVFGHGDLEHLERLLHGARHARRRLVLTESVFSMDGDSAPLTAMAQLCETHAAHLLVDEAHAVGVLGPDGAGAWAAAVAEGAPRAPLVARVVTGGKALGVTGALVLGSATLREHLLQRARSFVFSTGVSPAVSGALLVAVDLCRRAEQARATLREQACGLASALGLPRPAAAIVSVPVGDDERAMEDAARLQAMGLEVRAVRPPTVPPGTARLRVAVHTHNDDSQLERLRTALLERGLPTPVTPITLQRASPLFVVGTDTGVGKTVVAALFARAAARRGRARYWKPVQTGSESDTREVERLCAGSGLELLDPTFCFELPASPHEAAAAAGSRIQMEVLDARLDEELAQAGALIVELAGGLMVPLEDDRLQIDWLASRRPPLVLVARSGLGTLNHTLLSFEALDARGLTPRALILVGTRHASNRATLARRTSVPVVELPLFSDLCPKALEDWLADHDLTPFLE